MELQVWYSNAIPVCERSPLLDGLLLPSIRLSARRRVLPPKPKAKLPKIGNYPIALEQKGWTTRLGQQWTSMWNWTTKGMQNRAWPAKSFKKKPPVAKAKLDAFERKHDVTLPPILRNVLEEFSASVQINHNSAKPYFLG